MKLFLFSVTAELKESNNWPYNYYVLADTAEIAEKKIKKHLKKCEDKYRFEIRMVLMLALTLEEYEKDELDDSYRPLLV